ncbi:MAG TPA: hypothetical protein VGX68_26560 [Thermoanaerobaculia bacterium]|jgi:hypothetical protein|nr:hypothetical protein [Thermoanaerobaculia bacterium]
MRNNFRVTFCALGLGLLAASAALPAGREVALGSDGEVFAIRTGTYGDLFPTGRDFDRANPVVALEIAKPGAAAQRILVPGTGGEEAESAPTVLFEESSQTIFVLWESELNFHPILQLVGFDGSAWSRPIEVIGNPFASKTSPQFVVTRDSYEEQGADGSVASRHRTILHLVWQEENAGGSFSTFYSPILIGDEGYFGWNPVYNLDEYLQDRVTPSAGGAQAALARAPIVETGRDERTVVIAYTSTVMGRLAAIEVDVLPEHVSQLADKARSHIIDLGRKLYPSDLAGLADKARSHIIDLGHAFRPEVVQAMADQVKAIILAGGTPGLEALADKARSHIIDLGAQLSGRGLRGTNGADATAKLLEVDPDPGAPETAAASGPYLFQFRVVSNLPVPRVGPGTVRLFVSPSGENLTLSWAQTDRVVYRNSRDNGWTDARELRFSDSLNLTKAYEILEQRLSNR